MKTAPSVLFVLSLLSLAASSLAQSGVAASSSPAQAAFSAFSVQQADLAGSDAEEFSFFGYSVTAHGDTVVVGAPGYVDEMGNSQSGKVYVFIKPASGWKNMVQTAELSASDNGNDANAGFGYAVAFADNTIFVGAPGVAKVYVFVEPAGGWRNMTETAVIQDQAMDIGFGSSVGADASAATLCVGAVYASQAGTLAGAAYVFLKPAGGWISTTTPNAELTASDALPYDNLGNSIAVSGTTVVVGAAFKPTLLYYGAAYVFVKPVSGWTNMTETAKLSSSKPVANAQLGSSLSISGNTIVAGAPGPAPVSGNAYIFVEPSGGWRNSTEAAKMNAGNPYEDAFGASVSLTGDMLAVGASVATVGTASDEGAAYLYLKPASGWKSTSKFNYEFTDQYGIQYDGLGFSLALNGDTLVTGAPFAYNLTDIGYAYVFTF
jgi:hypothetical protein